MNLHPKNFKYKYIIILILLLILNLLYYLAVYIYNDSFEEIKKYLNNNLAGKLNYPNQFFFNENKPKISIVIPTFNGEGYLKPVTRSIQNQNFREIEIIIVDDGSMDDTIRVIKELMEEDKRIKFIKNNKNRGTLYSKTRGVLNSKGKYVMTLDHDNFYANNNALSTLYYEAEKDNLDLLGFASITTQVEMHNLRKKNFVNYFKTSIIKKPNIKKRILGFNTEHSCPFLCHYFIRKDLFLKVINQLGEEFINRNIDSHDDTIIMFLLSRNALSLKHLKKIFYIIFIWPQNYSISLNFQQKVKKKERERKKCFSYLTFAEILLLFTDDNKQDKKIASQHFLYWYFKDGKCQYKKDLNNETIRISNLYLNNQYISRGTKKKILFNLKKIASGLA